MDPSEAPFAPHFSAHFHNLPFYSCLVSNGHYNAGGGDACFRREDYAAAAEHFQRGSDEGDAHSQVRLGMLYNAGSGVAANGRDLAKAAKLWHLARGPRPCYRGVQPRRGVPKRRRSTSRPWGLARMSTERRCAPDHPFLRQESGSLEHHGEVDMPPLADFVTKEEVAWVQSARGVRLFQTVDEHGAEAHNATMPWGDQVPC